MDASSLLGPTPVEGAGGQVVIVGACRTPLAPRNGALGGCHPAELLAVLLERLVPAAGIDPAVVGDVVAGCSTAIGAQALNITRQAVLAAGWPESVPGLTLDRQGASGLDALGYGIAAVGSGLHDVVVAAGVEAMTLVPAGAAVEDGSFGLPFGAAVNRRYRAAGGLLPAGRAADAAAAGWGLTRPDLDAWALDSHARAAIAAEGGRPGPAELVPVPETRFDREARRPVATGRLVRDDETVDRKLTAEALAGYRPAYADDGVTTAGNSAPMADGAAAVLLMTERRAAELGLAVLARPLATATRGVSPLSPLDAPLVATEAVLARAGLAAGDLDRAEVDECFAAVPLAWRRRFDLDRGRVNPDGGAIGLGLPLAAGGLRALVSLVHHLAPGGRRGLVVAGAVGGVATAVVVSSRD